MIQKWTQKCTFDAYTVSGRFWDQFSRGKILMPITDLPLPKTRAVHRVQWKLGFWRWGNTWSICYTYAIGRGCDCLVNICSVPLCLSRWVCFVCFTDCDRHLSTTSRKYKVGQKLKPAKYFIVYNVPCINRCISHRRIQLVFCVKRQVTRIWLGPDVLRTGYKRNATFSIDLISIALNLYFYATVFGRLIVLRTVTHAEPARGFGDSSPTEDNFFTTKIIAHY